MIYLKLMRQYAKFLIPLLLLIAIFFIFRGIYKIGYSTGKIEGINEQKLIFEIEQAKANQLQDERINNIKKTLNKAKSLKHAKINNDNSDLSNDILLNALE